MILELVGQQTVPSRWEDDNQARNINVLKAPEEILAAAQRKDIVAKIHSYERDFLLWLKGHGARIIVTRRDEVDILASHHHHFSKEKIRLPVWFYAATIGLLKAIEVNVYRQIATSVDVADIVIDYADLKSDPIGVLQEVVQKLGLPYSPDCVVEAAERADMRGKDYSEKFAGMEQREWFFRRNDKALKPSQRRILKACTGFAEMLVAMGPLRKLLVRMLFLDSRRSHFSRSGGKSISG